LPRYIKEAFLNEAFEERFEGILYMFFNELITDFNFSDDIRRTYFKTILDKITDTLSHYDSVLLKPKKLPSHLLQTFTLLKNEYQKAYKLIFKEFHVQLGGYYHFENKLIKTPKNYTSQSQNYFKKCDNVVISDSMAKNLRSSLVTKKLISPNTNPLTLKNAFSDGSHTKINWLGGKDQLGCFIKLLKDEKVITGQAHSAAKNIFTVNGDKISYLRTPPADETQNYVEMLKSIIRDNLLPSTSK
ncbi:MAG: hypothetical protein KDC67_13945, partial [Ignavibacteriae bacterium]|nr:hypothetical protein [Ignavibacteriota bacterium]